MSYNISAWKIRNIHLRLPINFGFQSWLQSQPGTDEHGYENVGRRWLLEHKDSFVHINAADSTWKIPIMNDELAGTIVGQSLFLTDLEGWTEDGSGHLYGDILIPLFKEFKGTLDAIVVWEGGDSIYHVVIHDGIVEEEEIC